MGNKWVVAFEYDLKEGLGFLARTNAGQGEVALFNSKEDAERWVEVSGDIDESLWDINLIKIQIDE